MSILRQALLYVAASTMIGCTFFTPSRSEGELRPGTAWVASSPDWTSEAQAVYSEATDHIRAIESGLPDGSWYVVLDLDETVLNNVVYQAQLDRSGATFTKETWFLWTQRKEATPVPGAIDFIKYIGRAGGHVAFVTNRLDIEQLATESNLAQLGLTRGRDYRVLLTRGSPDGPSDKDGRFQLIPALLQTQGYQTTVALAYIGDTKGDKPSTRGEWSFFCVDQGAMYGDYCAEVPRSGR